MINKKASHRTTNNNLVYAGSMELADIHRFIDSKVFRIQRPDFREKKFKYKSALQKNRADTKDY
jgi:hypothetical protein